MLQYAVILGAMAELAGKYYYIKNTLLGKTKPNKVTWLMWTVAPIIATFAALADGVRWAVLPVFMTGFGCLLVLLAALANPKSYWKLEKFDYLCGICSLLALILWWITKESYIAILFAIIADGFAAVPTIIKSWKFPDTESVETYLGALFSALTSFLALKKFTFTEIAFPLYLVIVCSIIITGIYKGGRLSLNK